MVHIHAFEDKGGEEEIDLSLSLASYPYEPRNSSLHSAGQRLSGDTSNVGGLKRTGLENIDLNLDFDSQYANLRPGFISCRKRLFGEITPDIEEPELERRASNTNYSNHPLGPLGFRLGYRFLPIEFEVITSYLNKKIEDPSISFSFIPVCKDLYQKHPEIILEGAPDNEAYFFFELPRKHKNATRVVKEIGSWRLDGEPKGVYDENSQAVGLKGSLCFTLKGEKKRSKVLMKEFASNQPSNWVICRLYEKSSSNKDK